MKCLIISNPDDVHTRVVTRKLKDLACEPILFYPEKLGVSAQIVIRSYPHFKAELIDAENAIDFLSPDIGSVWYRRPRWVNPNHFALDAAATEFALDEWKHLINGLYELLADRFWVSSPDALAKCERKVAQLQVASKLGFEIPKTLFTNHLSALQMGFSEWHQNAIAKPIGRGWVIEDETLKYIMTNKIGVEHLQHPDGLKVAPITAQEYIEKDYELRITIVGKKIFATKIDSQKSDVSKVDWRRYDMENTPYSPYELPENIAHLCLQLLDYYQLNYGAIDMIKTPDGRYVFLEINGNGQFLWVEKAVGFDISGALAVLLANIK